jgi:hypothetical protein
MNANDTTPSNGECVSDELFDYQYVAETLLQQELERISCDISSEFMQASQKVADGKELDRDDVLALECELERATETVETLRYAVNTVDENLMLERMRDE